MRPVWVWPSRSQPERFQCEGSHIWRDADSTTYVTKCQMRILGLEEDAQDEKCFPYHFYFCKEIKKQQQRLKDHARSQWCIKGKKWLFPYILILTEKRSFSRCREARLDCCLSSGVGVFAWLYDQEEYLLYLLLNRHDVKISSWLEMHLKILIYEKHNICNYIYWIFRCIWVFKLLNFMEILKRLFRFIHSFSDASPTLPVAPCDHGDIRTPKTLFRFIYMMFIFPNKTS